MLGIIILFTFGLVVIALGLFWFMTGQGDLGSPVSAFEP